MKIQMSEALEEMVVQDLTSPHSILWREVLPGVSTSVLAGRPEEPGSPFVVLYRVAIPLVMPTHAHAEEEHVTVIDGTLEIGVGDSFDASALEELGPGSYAVIPGGVRHCMRYAAGSVVQIHGIGPFDMQQ